jgi:hypothetical protein
MPHDLNYFWKIYGAVYFRNRRLEFPLLIIFGFITFKIIICSFHKTPFCTSPHQIIGTSLMLLYFKLLDNLLVEHFRKEILALSYFNYVYIPTKFYMSPTRIVHILVVLMWWLVLDCLNMNTCTSNCCAFKLPFSEFWKSVWYASHLKNNLDFLGR